MPDQIQIRRGTAAAWTSAATTPAQGEPCLETDTGRQKIGDGATAWSTLPYSNGSVFNVRLYGATGDGSTDDSAHVQSAITAAQVNGGTVYFPTGTYLISTAITPIPYGSSCPYIRFTGDGSYANGSWTTGELGASVLKLTYSTGPAKIDTRGYGLFEIDHLSLVSSGSDNNPFIQTTNTTIKVHDCYFSGNPSNSGTACQQDAIVCGGTNNSDFNTGASDAPFQGYGTVVNGNFFDKIRRAFFGQIDANGIVVKDNTISSTCGSNLSGGAAFEWVGYSDPTNDDYGNILRDNLIEVSHYVYASAWTNAVNNVIAGNGCYDHTGTTLASHRFNAGAYQNLVIDGTTDQAIPSISSAWSGSQMLVSANPVTPSVYPFGLVVGGGGGTGGIQIPEIANGRQGTAALNGTTAVVVSNTSITANSRIFLTIQTPGGTPASPYVSARSAGTSFSIKSTGASDTSTVAYFITEPGSTSL